MHIILGIIGVVVLLSFCSSDHSSSASSDEYRNIAWIAQMEDNVRNRLKDPESAKFSQSKVYRGFKGAPMVCGFVNAKNSYGGYIGDKGFIAAGDLIWLQGNDMQDSEFEKLWTQVCID